MITWARTTAITGQVQWVGYRNGIEVGRITKHFRTPKNSGSWSPTIPLYNGHFTLKAAKAEIEGRNK